MVVYRIYYIEKESKYYLSMDGFDTQEVLKAELFASKEEALERVKADAEETESSVEEYTVEAVELKEVA